MVAMVCCGGNSLLWWGGLLWQGFVVVGPVCCGGSGLLWPQFVVALWESFV